MNFQQQPTISEQITDTLRPENVMNSVNESADIVSDAVENAKETINTSVQDFSSKSYIESGREFLESNSMIAKFVFLILVLIIFFICLTLGISLITYFLSPSPNPYVISGVISGTTFVNIPQDPTKPNAVTIYRSNNQESGMEFTWCLWLNLDNMVGTAKNQHIFSKGGNGTFATDGTMAINNAPGLYLNPPPITNNNTSNPSTSSPPTTSKKNTLRVLMNTVDTESTENIQNAEFVDIDNIPFRKWVHVAIRLQNKVLDVYINGTIAKRVLLINVPKQNYDDVFVCGNGGFNGSLSDLRYFSKALNVFEIMQITSAGPSLSTSSSNSLTSKVTDYLSNSWYSRQ